MCIRDRHILELVQIYFLQTYKYKKGYIDKREYQQILEWVQDGEYQSLYEDFILLGPLSVVILVVSILIFMRSWLSAFIPLVTSLLTIIWTFGMMGWVGVPLNILSAMIPSLIIVIGSTEDTHMMAAFLRGLSQKQSGGSRKEAVKYMAKHIGLPMMLTVLTTSLGFASNLFSDIGLIQHFSFAATFAMLANGLITILIMPLMLSIFGAKTSTHLVQAAKRTSMPERIMSIFRIFQAHFPKSILFFTALLCSFFIYQATKLYVTNEPLSYFPSDRPLIMDDKRIHEDLAGIKISTFNFYQIVYPPSQTIVEPVT